MEYEKKLHKIFNSSIAPIKLGLYYSHAKYMDFICLHSNDSDTAMGKVISIYETPSLLRTLALKSEIFSMDLREKMYLNCEAELCFILEWNDRRKKVAFFNLRNLVTFDEAQFLDTLESKGHELLHIFNELYYKKESF